MTALADAVLSGDIRALSRLLTHIQNESPPAKEALAVLYPHTGRAHLVGITGAPGTGKSSLVNSLAKAYRAKGLTVGIIAVDPTSPFSGGAVLGDRIRMRDLAGDRGVFIRSMATRGSLGGLARTTGDAVRALDAAGFDVILIETVGAGQSEVEIAHEAHTTVVVEAPGLGDDVQAIKAGILEIADILVVNKADQPNTQHTVRALKAMLDLGANRPSEFWHHSRLSPESSLPAQPEAADHWETPVIETVAITDDGVEPLLQAIDTHYEYLRSSQRLHIWERARLESELASRLKDALLDRLVQHTGQEKVKQILDQLTERVIDPHTATESLLNAANSHRQGWNSTAIQDQE